MQLRIDRVGHPRHIERPLQKRADPLRLAEQHDLRRLRDLDVRLDSRHRNQFGRGQRNGLHPDRGPAQQRDAVLAALNGAGLDGSTLVANADDAATKATLVAQTEAAVARGVSAPCPLG